MAAHNVTLRFKLQTDASNPILKKVVVTRNKEISFRITISGSPDTGFISLSRENGTPIVSVIGQQVVTPEKSVDLNTWLPKVNETGWGLILLYPNSCI